MAVVNLPDSPADGTTQTVNGISYTYNSSKGYWTTSSSGTTTIQVTTSDSAPSGPADGDLWYDTDYGGMFVYYADGTSNQWVEVVGTQGAQGTLKTSDSAPSNPSDGDLWYDTDDGGLFIYYADGSSNQWVEVVGASGPVGPQGPAGAAGATTIVANTTALLAISSPSTGELAYVTGNSTLYFYNGSGWYKIALINATPSISGVSATYDLATDGTATTVTIVASDPEGLPITYSIASDTSGNVATVTQGTGSNTNVFTITPSTNTAHAGTFSLTFRASDGVNFATAASSFTLQFAVQNQNYTTALVTSVGANNAVNNSFDDKSTNDHTITVVGDSHHCGMSPYRPGGYSTYFDGNGDYLTSNSNGIANFGTDAFTIEGWLYLVAYPSQWNFVLDTRSSGSDSNRVCIEVTPSDFGIYAGENMCRSGSGFGLKEWKHWAYTRDSSGNHKVFINGTQVGSTFTGSKNYTTDNFRVSAGHNGGDNQNAYQRDLRVIKGTALYTANFTPPTEPLTAVTNTSFLGCHLPYIADGSTNAHSIVVSGDTHTLPFAPYDTQPYTNATHLGSVHFDGSGDYLHMPQTSLDLGSDDFCVEAWVYTYSTANQAIIGSYRYADGVGSWNLNVNYNSNKLRFFIRHSGGTVIDGQFESGTFPKRQWTHVAVTRDGANLRAFINGKQAGSTNTSLGSSSIDNAITTYRVGIANDNNIPWTGNFTDVRVVKGSSVYTSNFTPPTSALSTITNTILHLPMADGGIIDKAQTTNTLKLYGDAKSSTTQTKYLTSSMYFDGTGDYVKVAPAFSQFFNMTGPYTIEFWFYADGAQPNNYPVIFGTASGSWGAGAMDIRYSPSGYANKIGIVRNGSNNVATGYAIVSSSTYAVDTWHHVALSRDASNNWRLFVNGSETGTSITESSAHNWAHGDHSRIGNNGWDGAGGHFKGYVSDLRITKGLARYTSNFTAPTAALQG